MVRTHSLLLLLFLSGACSDPAPRDLLYVDDLDDGKKGRGTKDDPYRHLQDAIDAAADGATIVIREGEHRAEPRPYVDPTCGNCDHDEFRTPADATVGFRVKGKAVHLVGDSRERTVLSTGAGYGLLFERAGSSSVERLTVTDGVRDADGRATDAAIVVRHTALRVEAVDLVDNDDLYDGEPDPVVGIMGIAGREGADLVVVGSRIEDNSWDGIALYNSDPEVPGSAARATIVGNVIGCTRNCVHPRGRGVGIGVTWDAEASIVNNRVHHYWKGIGSFGESTVVATNNLVHDQWGWGVIAAGESTMTAVNNVIADNGTTGLSAWTEESRTTFVNNVVTGNGWNDDEWVGKRTGAWLNADEVDFRYNDVWGNVPVDACRGGVPGGSACESIEFAGVEGNFAADPVFSGDESYRPGEGSPLVDAGDPAIADADGSRSDVGAHGGPDAGRTVP